MVATATGPQGSGLRAGTLSQFTAPAMRKEMHWSFTAGALLALTLHHPRLLQAVVGEMTPASLERLQRVRVADLLLPGASQASERSE
jgi:hypothetical protein